MEFLRSCLFLLSGLGVVIGGLVLEAVAFWVDQKWLAFPAVVIVAAGISVLHFACYGNDGRSGRMGGQVVELTKV